VTGNDVTLPQVTGSDPEVTSFDRKSPGSGWRRLKTRVYGTFHFVHGCSLHKAVTWQDMTSRDLRWPEVTRKWCHLTGSPLEVAIEGRKHVYCTFHFLQSCSSQEETHVTGNDVTWPQVTGNDPEVTSFDHKSPRVAGEGQKLAYTVHFTSYRAVARRRRHSKENNVTCPQVTGSDLELTSFDRKSPGSGCRRPKTGVYCTFNFLQGCSSQEEAVMWRKMTSRDLRWLEVTRKSRHLTGSPLEEAVEGWKVAYTVHLTFYKAVARWKRLPHDRKWHHVTSGDRNPEVT